MLTADDRRAIRREVFRQTWPVVLQYFFRTMMFLVDTIMVKEVGTTAVATMGIVGPVTYTLIMLMMALSAATTATVARAWGERDREKQERAAATSIRLALLLAAPAMLAGMVGMPAFARFLAPASPEIAATAGDYLVILSAAFPFFLLEFAAGSVLRAAGDTRTPMVLAVLGNVVNVALNYVLIFGKFGAPALGVQGAALASAAAIAVQGSLTLLVVMSPGSRIRLTVASFRLVTGESMRTLARIAVPALAEPIVLQSGFLLYTRFIAALGDLPLAAHRSAIAVESLSFMPGYAVSIAAGALVGQYLGEGRADRAKAAVRESMRLGVGIMLVNAVLFLSIPHLLLWPFAPRDTAEPLILGTEVLKIASMEQLFMAMAMVLAGAMRGAGDTKSPAWIGFVGTWGVRVPCAYGLAIGLGFGLHGIWITMVLDWMVRSVLSWVLWARGSWERIKL